APADNPFFLAIDGITAKDFVYSYGIRNAFGGDWRISDGKHYIDDNGPNVDRLSRAESGVNYGWDGTDASMTNHAIYNWTPSVAPLDLIIIENTLAKFSGSTYPTNKYGHAF